MNKLLFCLLLTMLLLTGNLFAAQGVIKGRVVDAKTGDPLPGTNVLIKGTNKGAASDLKGYYIINNVPPGEYTLKVTYIGYEAQELTVTVEFDKTTVQDINLVYGQVLKGETVVVTAQASGQLAAINQQLSSNTITNIVSEARIKELPDVNAAESIGRLPGVSINRSGGEATTISIRGLSPKHNMVSVNGIRIPSTSGDDRSVDLSLISSSMLDGIEVKKANTADMDADAIGGTVDLKLKEAPEDMQINVSLQGGYNQLQDYTGNYNFSGSISRRFLDNRLGVIANVNLDDYDRSADKFQSNYYLTSDPLTSEELIAVDEMRMREENVKRRRMGGSLLMDYRIPLGKVTLNTFYNRLKSDALNRINFLDAENSRHYYDLERRVGTTEIFTGDIGIAQNFKWIRYDAGFAVTASRADNPEDFSWRFGKEGAIWEGGIKPGLTTLTTDFFPHVVENDSATALHHIWVYETERKEDVKLGQFNITLPVSITDWITGSIKTGAKFRRLDRLNDEEQNGRAGWQYGSGANNLNGPFEQVAVQLPDWDLATIVGTEGWLPVYDVADNYSRSNFLDGVYPLGYTFLENKMMEFTRALQRTRDSLGVSDSEYRNNAIGSRGRDYDGYEEYKAWYIMGEFNIGKHVTFIPGIRWEADYSKYHGQRFREIISAWQDQDPVDLDTLTNVREHDFWLPMIHLQVKPNNWLNVRLAYTKTLTRPDYIQYAPITRLDTWGTTINAANAGLKPAVSANWDLAASVYHNYVGLFTLAGFYKSIDDLIIGADFQLHQDVYNQMPEGLNIPSSWTQKVPRVYTNINNPFETTYQGFEIDWQTNFWYLPSFLKGLVLSANYTYIESETQYRAYYLVDSDSIKTQRPRTYYKTLKDSLRTGRMPDQPTHIANVTFGYDYKNFSARLSFLYQTDMSTYINPSRPFQDTFSDDYFRLDLTLKQRLSDSIELFANFNNLNSMEDRSYRGLTTNQPSYIEYYGFTMDIGARYRF